MKNLIWILLPLILVSCQTHQPKKEQVLKNYQLDLGPFIDNASVSGWTAFVQINVAPKNATELAILEGYKKKFEEKLSSLGFKIVNHRLDANVVVAFALSIQKASVMYPESFTVDIEGGVLQIKRAHLEDGSSIASELSFSKNDFLAEYYFMIMGQSYGQRYFDLLWKRMVTKPDEELRADYVEALVVSGMSELDKLATMVKEKKQVGPPGCMPRFGFDFEKVLYKGSYEAKITSLGSMGSPARRAGMQVGDILLSVDSYSYPQFSVDPSLNRRIYNEKIQVPIKLIRGDKEVRSQIKARVLCE